MWIKTQGGYLLNLDNVEFIIYDSGNDNTYAYGGSDTRFYIIGEGNRVDSVYENLNRGTKIMEVR